MRSFMQLSAILILFTLCSTITDACCGYDYQKEDLSGYNLQPDLILTKNPEYDTDYSRNGHAVYVYAGGLFTHYFFLNSNITAYSGSNTLSYNPSTTFQPNYYGFHLGVAKELTKLFDAQLTYLQTLTQNRTNGSISSSYRTLDIVLDVAWILNPDSQFQVSLQGGAALTEATTSLNSRGISYSPPQSLTEINPEIGAGLAVFMTPSWAIRLSGMYIADLSKVNSNGNINALLGLSYVI